MTLRDSADITGGAEHVAKSLTATSVPDPGGRKARWRWIVGIGLTVALLFVAASWLTGGTADRSGYILPKSRVSAPSLVGETLSGNSYSGLKPGSLTVVNFWASYCAPCRAEASQLNLTAKNHPAVSFVGVDEDHDAVAGARQYLADFKVPYPSIHDTDDSIWVRWPVSPGLPVTYVVDRRGRIAAMITGGITSGMLSALLARIAAQ